MKVTIPDKYYTRPFRLWLLIGFYLLRNRFSYFVIFPLCVAAGLAWQGMEPLRLALTAALAFVFCWASLTTHEFAHVAILLRESYGFAAVDLQFSPGGLRTVREHASWFWYKIQSYLGSKGLPHKAEEAPAPPEAGYLRVVTNMIMSSSSKMRIALAGVVMPFLIWLLALGIWLALYWSGQSFAVVPGAAILAAGLVYLIVHPFFAGVMFNGKAYSDLGYVGNFLMRDRDVRDADPIITTARLVWRIAAQTPSLVLAFLQYLLRPKSVTVVSRIESMKPKRSCLSWVYKRDPQGEFTDNVILLAPLGMSLLKRLTASPRGPERAEASRLMADPELLRQLVSYDKVYAVEFNLLASRAWELADGEFTMHEIATQISEETSQEYEVVLPALRHFYSDMHGKYMLNLNWPREPVREYPSLPDVVFDYGNIAGMVHTVLGSRA